MIGSTIKRKRDGARYKVASAASGGMYFLIAQDATGWPSLWETAETIRDEYDVIALPRDLTEEQATRAQSRGAIRQYVRAYVRERTGRERVADEVGLEPDELPRDRPGMWRRVYSEDPQ